VQYGTVHLCTIYGIVHLCTIYETVHLCTICKSCKCTQVCIICFFYLFWPGERREAQIANYRLLSTYSLCLSSFPSLHLDTAGDPILLLGCETSVKLSYRTQPQGIHTLSLRFVFQIIPRRCRMRKYPNKDLWIRPDVHAECKQLPVSAGCHLWLLLHGHVQRACSPDLHRRNQRKTCADRSTAPVFT